MDLRIVLKTGQQEKLYPPSDVSGPLQCHPQLVSVMFENLVHSIFSKDNFYFRALHWQHSQPPASAPV